MRIDQLKGELRNGVAVGNRYQVLFPTTNLRGPSSITIDRLNILCDSVTIPGRQVMTTERYTSSKAIKVPYGYANEDINMTFIVSNDWFVHDWLRILQGKVIDNMGEQSAEGKFVQYKETFTFDFEIQTLNQNDEVTSGYKIMNAFCTGLSSVELGNNNSDLVRVTSTWSYDDWKKEDYRVPTKSVTSTWINPDAVSPF